MSPRRVGAFLAVCALIVCARVTWDASRTYAEGRGFEAAGQPHEAAVRYGRTLHSYLPLLPTPHRASERLVALAERARAANDPAEERFCWEELRSGWLSVRSAWQPGAAWIVQADDAITRLVLEADGALWPDPEASPEDREAIVRARLAAREDPAVGWVLLMGLGWLVWIGAAATAIWRGIPADDERPLRWPVVGRWAGLSAAGYLVWLLGLWQA